MLSINEVQNEVIEEFEAFDDWLDRYQLLIDFGNELQPMPKSDMNEQNLIDGCQSKVWFTAKMQDGVIHFTGYSDALLVKGIVALLLRVLNDRTPKEIIEANLYFIDEIGLREHLSPTRSNGVAAMLKQLKLYALALNS